MTIKEEMTNLRLKNWNDVIRISTGKIKECLLRYQDYEEFVSKEYTIELVATLDKDEDITIICIINDMLISFDENGEVKEVEKNGENIDPFIITWMNRSEAVLEYSVLMENNLYSEGFTIVDALSEKFELNDAGKIVILKATLSVV